MLGAATVFGVFGVTLFASVLPAIAKDLPKDVLNHIPEYRPRPIPESMPWLEPGQISLAGIVREIRKALSGAVGSICGGAVASGSYLLGTVSGVIVVIVLFYTPKK